MKDVAILMSTYNGEKYILKQLNSLLLQINVSYDIWIRDDGSTDSTIEIIEKMIKNHDNIFLIKGNNLKPKLSFLNLLRLVKEYRFYAYCDQDDIWDPNKMSKAINYLLQYDKNVPNCYFSNYRLIDANDNIIQEMGNKFQGLFNFNNIIVDNPAPGGSMVINNAAKELINNAPYPQYCVMHDRWSLLVCASIGNIVYDNEPSYSYRQHENNVIGYGKNNFLSKVKMELKDLFTSNQYPLDKEMDELLSFYSKKIDLEKIKLLKIIINYKKNLLCRLKLVFHNEIKSYNKKRTILFKIKVCLKKR